MPETDAHAPRLQGLDLFEQYEASGSLLAVASDMTSLQLEAGDFIVMRAWSTSSIPIERVRARKAFGNPPAEHRRPTDATSGEGA